MKKITLLLCTTLLLSLITFAQVANPPTSLEICDNDGVQDGFATFDLTIKNAEVLGSQNPNDYSVSYYETQMDANAGANPLPNPYTNVTSPQTVFVRVVELSTGSFDTTTLELVVEPIPVVFMPIPLEYCDSDSDGFGVFTLTDADNDITGGAPDLIVTYHETLSDAENSTNMLSSPYNNIIIFTQTVYARVESSTVINCASFVELDLLVNPTPQITDPIALEVCDDNTDGFAIFDLTSSNSEILNLLDADMTNDLDPTQYTLTHYLSAADANAGANSLAMPNAFTNLVNPQTVWVRVQDNTTACYNITTLELIVVICVDSDSDGVDDADEDINGNGNLDDDDTDMDMIPNYLDDDDDGDNVDTIVEINIPTSKMPQHPFVDTDGDLIENYLDDDDDGDNILTIDEDYNNNGDPTDDDTDMSGTPDYLEINVALSINEFSSDDLFFLYPNPTSENVMVKFNNALSGNISVEIINVQGKLVMQDTMAETFQLNIKHLEAGLYFVKLKNNNKQMIKKLIIE